MIQISPAAKQEIQRLWGQKTTVPVVRLRLLPGGCLDWLYHLDFQAEAEVDPHQATVYAVDDLQVSVANNQQQYLANLAIDYSEDLMGGGFRFANPNASRHCSCGHSFAASDVAIAAYDHSSQN